MISNSAATTASKAALGKPNSVNPTPAIIPMASIKINSPRTQPPSFSSTSSQTVLTLRARWAGTLRRSTRLIEARSTNQ